MEHALLALLLEERAAAGGGGSAGAMLSSQVLANITNAADAPAPTAFGGGDGGGDAEARMEAWRRQDAAATARRRVSAAGEPSRRSLSERSLRASCRRELRPGFGGSADHRERRQRS